MFLDSSNSNPTNTHIALPPRRRLTYLASHGHPHIPEKSFSSGTILSRGILDSADHTFGSARLKDSEQDPLMVT